MSNLSEKTREDIFRGSITEHAVLHAGYREISLERAAEIIKEIADEITK